MLGNAVPTILNYNAKEYPTIDGLKKQHINDTTPTDISTNVNTAGDTLTAVDLDELQSAYESKCEVLQQQIAAQWTEMENMRNQIQQTFEKQLQQL